MFYRTVNYVDSRDSHPPRTVGGGVSQTDTGRWMMTIKAGCQQQHSDAGSGDYNAGIAIGGAVDAGDGYRRIPEPEYCMGRGLAIDSSGCFHSGLLFESTGRQ